MEYFRGSPHIRVYEIIKNKKPLKFIKNATFNIIKHKNKIFSSKYLEF